MNWKQLFFASLVFIFYTLCGKIWTLAFDARNIEQGFLFFIIGSICYILGYETMIKYGKLVRNKKINP